MHDIFEKLPAELGILPLCSQPPCQDLSCCLSGLLDQRTILLPQGPSRIRHSKEAKDLAIEGNTHGDAAAVVKRWVGLHLDRPFRLQHLRSVALAYPVVPHAAVPATPKYSLTAFRVNILTDGRDCQHSVVEIQAHNRVAEKSTKVFSE